MPIIGDVLAARYRIDATLGAGGTAVVYRAHDLRLARDVALKVLLPNLAQDPALAARFEREARALAAINHPGVVSIFDVEPGDPAAGREPFYVMELCPDGSLADELSAAGGRLPPETVVPIILDVAAGLAAMHARGVIHRDVKPHNILLTSAGAKLADFGLARASETTRFTAPGTAVGTLAYLAPELLDGQPASAASDVYGLGVAAFQALTGRLPRPSGSMVDLVDARRLAVTSVSAAAPGIGEAFDAAVGAALEVDPSRRPDARTFANGLKGAMAAWRAAGSPRPMAVPAGVGAAGVGAAGVGAAGAAGVAAAAGASGAAAGPRAAAGAGIRGTAPARPPTDESRTVAVRLDRGPGSAAGGTGVAGWLVRFAAVAGLVVLILAGIVWLGGITGGRSPVATVKPTPRPIATASPTASATATASASASPTASPTPSPPPTPSPTPEPTAVPTPTPVVPTPTPFGNIYDPVQARAQIGNLRTAVINAVAIGQLGKGDQDMLNHQIDDVQQALDKDKPNMAAMGADKLLMSIDKLVQAGKVPQVGELRNAAVALRAALPSTGKP